MIYKTVSLPINQIIVKRGVIVESLCNKCESRDCENFIEKKQISIYGLVQTWRLINKSNSYEIVVDCEGYIVTG
jgi:hypothetical protein